MQHHLGRETFLAPVTWTEDGWPIIGDKGTLSEPMIGGNGSREGGDHVDIRDDFDEAILAPWWNFLRVPDPANWSLSRRSSCLTLYGAPAALNETGPVAFVGRRQQHFVCRIAAQLSFIPQRDGEEAGITVYMNERFHYELAVTQLWGGEEAYFP